MIRVLAARNKLRVKNTRSQLKEKILYMFRSGTPKTQTSKQANNKQTNIDTHKQE